MMSTWTLRIVGFVLAASAVLALELMLLAGVGELFDSQVMPRGAGWFIFPIMAGIGGAQWLSAHGRVQWGGISKAYPELRVVAAGVGSWALIVVSYAYMAAPWGRYWSDEEWFTLIKWIIVPPVVASIITALFYWAKQNKAHSG